MNQICAMLRPPRHKPITLAIGDGIFSFYFVVVVVALDGLFIGANDVTMIREADVGIGIFGKEGRQVLLL